MALPAFHKPNKQSALSALWSCQNQRQPESAKALPYTPPLPAGAYLTVINPFRYPTFQHFIIKSNKNIITKKQQLVQPGRQHKRAIAYEILKIKIQHDLQLKSKNSIYNAIFCTYFMKNKRILFRNCFIMMKFNGKRTVIFFVSDCHWTYL